MVILYFIFSAFCFTQTIYTDYLIVSNDTIDVFSYQIPEYYNPDTEHPLLIAFHQWGGNENSNYYTEFDEQANSRNWIMLCPYGGSSNNYNHQGMQDMIEQEILWMMDHFNINKNKIYMVGGSMGGATGAIYANNHLDPTKPMVAATASGSGILDCERRAIEMDGNNSMIEWFGGNWDEVPFEYHRNSAVYFADSTQSMHYNLQHTPLYLDFGITETHRTHAEDLYNLLLDYNESMWIDTNPTGSHGYPVFDENHVCEWFDQYSLSFLEEPQTPYSINVNLDEPSRAYWIQATNQFIENQFIRINANWIQSDGTRWEHIKINQINNCDSLILHILNQNIEDFALELHTPLNLGFTGPILNNQSNINSINIMGLSDNCEINYTLENDIIWLNSTILESEDLCYNGYSLNEGEYTISFVINSSETYNDINQDGLWNVIDIIMVINHVIGTDPLNNNQQELADLNEDGNINVLDIVEIMNIILRR